MPLRDDEENTTLAKKPDYGKNDFDQERRECNPLDLTKGCADDSQEDRDQQIDGKRDRAGDDND
jgi:hypothetical protein